MAALPAGNGGTGTWSVISGGATVTDIHSSVSQVTNLALGNNQFRWTISSQYGICPGSNDMVTISRDEAPAPAIAGGDQNLCSSSTAPLGANNATIGTASWSLVSGPVAPAPVFIPSAGNPNATVHILSGNEGIYQFAWTIINGSCRTSDTLAVDFGLPVPPADAGPADSVCGTNASLNGNNPGIGTGTWQKISGTGTVGYLPGIHSPSVIAQIEAGETGYYTFEWRIRSGSCPQTADTVGILFKPMPGPPVTEDTAICGAGALTLHSIPGSGADINRWYENSSGGILLLGSAETVGGFTDLFTPLNTKLRIFRRTESALRSGPIEFPSCFARPLPVGTEARPEPTPQLSLQSLADQLVLELA
jgi:hypothetical protein